MGVVTARGNTSMIMKIGVLIPLSEGFLESKKMSTSEVALSMKRGEIGRVGKIGRTSRQAIKINGIKNNTDRKWVLVG